MSKPRLLFISNLFPDARQSYRGLDNATVLHHLADRWDVATLAVRPVMPWGKKDWQPRDEDAGLGVRYVPSLYVPKIGHALNHRLMAAALRRKVREFRGAFQVALVAWLYPDACAVALLAKEMGFPFVAIAQGSDVHQYLQIGSRRRIMTKLLPAARGIVTRSADLSKRLAEVGLPKERLHPVYNGIDLELFRPGDQAEVRRELRLPAEGRIILFVGNFLPIKNPGLLVQALGRLRDEREFRDAMAIFIGGGPMEGEITFQASRGSAANHVMLAGRLAAPMVARFMQAADVLCLPSQNEGVPNVILEAFGTGLRVVASKVGGISEVHDGPHLGRLVVPRDLDALVDGLREVLSTPPERDRIRAHAERFTWAATAEQYHRLLSQAL